MNVGCIAVTILLVFVHLTLGQRSSADDRYQRPSHLERPCISGRCPDSGRDSYDNFKDNDRNRSERPISEYGDTKPGIRAETAYDEFRTKPEVTRSEHDKPKDVEKPSVGGSLNPIGSNRKPAEHDPKFVDTTEYKPKTEQASRPVARDDYRPKASSQDDYKPKPHIPEEYPISGGRDRYPEPGNRDEYPKPAGRDEYPKPAGRDEYPKPAGRDEYLKPVARDEYPKPIARDEYPIPVARDEYPKPAARDEYPKPAARDEYPKPVARDEFPKLAGRDEYPKPVARDEYPIPIARDEYPKPAARDEYPKPAARDEYPKPAARDEYPKPVARDEYPKPADRDEYPKLAVHDEYPKPAARDEYPKSVHRDEYPKSDHRDEYLKPAARDAYARPAVIDDYPKPAIRDEDKAPNFNNRDGYEIKPLIRDAYQRPDTRDGYVSKPLSRDDYESKSASPAEVRRRYDSRPTFPEDSDSKLTRRDEYGRKQDDKVDRDRRPVYRDDYDLADRDDSSRKPSRGGGGGGASGYAFPKPQSSSKADDRPYPHSSAPKRDEDAKSHEEYRGDSSKGTKDDNCICVPYYQCKEGHIVTDGGGIIDARRWHRQDEDLPLDGRFKPPSCGPFHVCCNTPETSTVRPYEHRCGVRNPSGINSRILVPSNKGEADFGEWPWQAAILKSEGTINIFQCGGVLIDRYHVLTVAHCVFHLEKYNNIPLKVRLGEWDTQTSTEFLAHEDYNVTKMIVHEEFKNSSLWNDIAILRLQEPVLFAPHIDTICLPKYDEVFSGQNCVVTGWGKDSYQGGTFSNVMKEVALQVVDNFNCEEMLRKTRLGRFFQLNEGFLCAGGEHGLDSCKGDGGGPLVCYRKDRSYALAGLVSWGIDCGQPGVPGVYVKVQKYLEWISKNTGVELSSYWPKD